MAVIRKASAINTQAFQLLTAANNLQWTAPESQMVFKAGLFGMHQHARIMPSLTKFDVHNSIEELCRLGFGAKLRIAVFEGSVFETVRQRKARWRERIQAVKHF